MEDDITVAFLHMHTHTHTSVAQQANGTLKLLVSHRRQSSNCSDLSLRSNVSSSVASSLQQPLYDEVIAPSGFRVGETKSVIVRKVRWCAEPEEVSGRGYNIIM